MYFIDIGACMMAFSFLEHFFRYYVICLTTCQPIFSSVLGMDFLCFKGIIFFEIENGAEI